jgi:hypothetical protein
VRYTWTGNWQVCNVHGEVGAVMQIQKHEVPKGWIVEY